MWTILGLTGILSSLLKIAASLLEAITPVIKGALELVVEFLKWMWHGFIDVIDDIRTVAFVAVVVMGSIVYGSINPVVKKVPFVGQNQCEKHIVLLKKQYDTCKAQMRSSKR
jgi:hypothetical protein